MSGASKKDEGRRLTCQRIAVNAQGYDSTGAYWGAGPDVFIVTTADGRDEITVRAKSVAEARTKATTELDRKPDQPRVKEPLGGASPHKARYEIDWRDPATGATVRLRITHSRDYLSQGSDHVEVESLRPKRAPLPITETGYRSHFMPALELMNAGGPVSFVEGWLAREAMGKHWQKQQAARQQGDLFQWAETQAEVGRKRARPKAPSAAKAKRRSPKPERAPE
jgi:hypothetical protein